MVWLLLVLLIAVNLIWLDIAASTARRNLELQHSNELLIQRAMVLQKAWDELDKADQELERAAFAAIAQLKAEDAVLRGALALLPAQKGN